MGSVRTWEHKRKGKFSGTFLSEDDTWMTIILSEDNYYGYAGETLTFRKTLAKEVTE